MKILSKYYQYNDKTTLNRMRKKPDAFKILISCLLSLRTKDKNTEKVSKQLFEIAKTPKEISNLPIKKLEKIIYSSGHYKKKARTLQHVSKELITRFNSNVPTKKQELLSIKGIGPKTANIVLAFAFGEGDPSLTQSVRLCRSHSPRTKCSVNISRAVCGRLRNTPPGPTSLIRSSDNRS